MLDIKPKLAAEPLRHRRSGEPWLDWAIEAHANTLAELALSASEWEATLKMSWPGENYRRMLKVQAKREERDIRRALDAKEQA